MSAQEIFNQARQLHNDKNFIEAEKLYRVLYNVCNDSLVLNHFLGLVLIAQKRTEEGLQHLKSAITIAENNNASTSTKDQITCDIANVILPSDHYFVSIETLATKLQPRGYLEIGVNTGDSLALIKSPTEAIGIDPSPKVSNPSDNARIYTLTSDEFFDNRCLAENHPDFKIDIGFIDGLHSFFQVIKDFINVEHHAHPGSIILIHDIYPPTRWAAAPTHNGGFWAGDGWKLFYFLQKFRPDLDISVVRAPPTGLGVVHNISPSNTTLRDALTAIIQEAEGLTFSVFEEQVLPRLRVVNTIEESVDISSWQDGPKQNQSWFDRTLGHSAGS